MVAETPGKTRWFGCIGSEQGSSAASVSKVQDPRLLLQAGSVESDS